MKTSKPKALLLHNTPAPYRLPLFTALAGCFELEVLFCQMQKEDRFWAAEAADYGFRYGRLHTRSVRIGGKTLLLNRGLVSYLRSGSYDVFILAHGPGMLLTLIVAMLVARLRRRPVVLWSGAVDLGGPRGRARLRHLLLRTMLYRWPAAFIAYGQRAADHLLGAGVPANRIFTGTQVLWPEQLPPPKLSKADLGLGGRRVVLCLSYLLERKGIQNLIRAFQALRRDDALLVIVGDGPYRATLEALAGASPNIVFAGYIEGDLKTSYYASADIFALPTLVDFWPNVIAEAMYFGLPIVATNAANCPELMGDNAFVVEPKPEAIADALALLLDDEALRQIMGMASQSLVRSYYGPRAVATFVQAVEKALGYHGTISCH
jgi:glycosyltransferase involved in cell wall biosynthesis